jgi:hypothetical protein
MNTELAKKLVIWSSLMGSLIFWGVFLLFIAKELWIKAPWIYSLFEKHPEVSLFIPLAALASLCNVLILKITDGPIELSFFKIEFKGASGPIIMWAFSFLVMCLGITMLWNM